MIVYFAEDYMYIVLCLQNTLPLKDHNTTRETHLPADQTRWLPHNKQTNQAEVRRDKRATQSTAAEHLCLQLPPNLQRSLEVAKEKGSSSWLVALPIENHGFSLQYKGAFRDALCLRYGWQLSLLPTTCACAQWEDFQPSATMRSVSQPISCQKCVMTYVCVEPPLQPLFAEFLSNSTANRDDAARLDIRACGFWGLQQQSAFFDVWVFNPNASTHRCLRVTDVMNKRSKEAAVEHTLIHSPSTTKTSTCQLLLYYPQHLTASNSYNQQHSTASNSCKYTLNLNISSTRKQCH